MEKERKAFTTGQKIRFTMVSILLFGVLILGAGEIATRLFYRPGAYFKKASMDDYFGWQPLADLSLEETTKDAGGQEHLVRFQTTRDGFREWGDIQIQDRPKVFFLGDSYTQSVEVSNEETFYHLLADSIPMEVFAFGQAGYGTLQQFLVLDRFVDEIQPDIVVLQTCDNDFIDNHFELELEGGYNLRLRRPYLRPDGKLRYLQPGSSAPALLHYSRFLSMLRKKVFVAQKRLLPDSLIAEAQITELGRAYAPFEEAVETTGMILDRMLERLPEKTRLLVFSASVFEPQLSEFRKLCEERGIPFFDQAAEAVKKAKWSGGVVNASDGYHWNEYGHRLVAKALLGPVRLQLQGPQE